MRTLTDLSVRRPDGTLVAIVEVKSRQGLTREMARDLRRSLMEHFASAAPFFLLVSQDNGFLWTANQTPDAEPGYEFSLQAIVSRYLPDLTASERLRHLELELLVFGWLNDVSGLQETPDSEPERSLDESGFIAALHGAQVSLEEAA